MIGPARRLRAAQVLVSLALAGACRHESEPATKAEVPSPRSPAPAAADAAVVTPSEPLSTAPASTQAVGVLSRLRSRDGSSAMLPGGVAETLRLEGQSLRPEFGSGVAKVSARVHLPRRARAPLHVEDAATGLSVEVALEEARDVGVEVADGYAVYPGAHASGATVLHRPTPDGVEDYIGFETQRNAAPVSYRVSLGEAVRGLRLVEGTLELLDAGGAPRLRVAPPYIVGADGIRTDAVLAVHGCAVDRNPAGPWGRPVTPPGARSCTVRVSWDDRQVTYPAILDPRWTTTGTMQASRQDHVAIRLASGPSVGKVLVAGGRSSSTTRTALASAELFDPATETWGAAQAMKGARYQATATQLNTSSNSGTSGKVLVAGGANGGTSDTSVGTFELFDPAAQTWTSSAISMSPAPPRHVHTATLLGNGSVALVGGMTNTNVIGSAAVYNPASGTGSWTAVTAVMSPVRRFHSATLLTSSNTNFGGRVLVAGGNSGGTTSLPSAVLFVPNSSAPAMSTWVSTTSFPTSPAPQAREGHTATVLANNNVLVTGGASGTTPMATTLVFTMPASGTAATWVNAGTLSAARTAHTATLLSTIIKLNGMVLVAGGADSTGTLDSAELWNGITTWTATTSLPARTQNHTATLLVNGKVLIAGGRNGTTLATVGRVYDPSFALACTSNAECGSGSCVNGVCCATSSCPTCQACNVTGNVGTCANAPSTTADSRCTASAPCGNTGLCDGAGACAKAATTVSCGAQTCSGSTLTGAAFCSGSGTCATATITSCNPYSCGTTSCKTSCSTDADCVSASFRCTGPGGTCVAKKANGDTCAGANECGSGFCADGVCCNSACGGACSACNLASTAGTCSPRPVNAPCADSTVCNGTETCDGAGTCRPGTPLSCPGAPQCSTVAACDPTTGCQAPVPASENSACNDVNLYTSNDVCRAGTCSGAVPTVNPGLVYGGLMEYPALDGAASMEANGINVAGDVTGTQRTATGSKVWRHTAATGTLAEIPIAAGDLGYTGWEADSIGSDGTVVGTSGWHGEAFRAAPGGGAEIITDRNGYASGAGINNAGQIAINAPAFVGTAYQGYISAGRRDTDGTKHFIGKMIGTPEAMSPTMGGGTFNWWSGVLDIDPLSTAMVGWAGMNEPNRSFDAGTFVFEIGWGMREAFRFTDPYTGPNDRHNLNDYAAANGWQLLYEGTATNDRYVVGWGARNRRCHAFRYTIATNEIVDLDPDHVLDVRHANGDLCGYADPGHFRYHVPTDINKHHEIVGNIAYGGAFYYSDVTGMIDLQDLVDPATHVMIGTANAISDNHEIVGLMNIEGETKGRAYKLTLPAGTQPTVHLRLDGIVDMSESGAGPYVALFGFNNSGAAAYHPRRNTVTVGTRVVANPIPAPPELFPTGDHPASFRPTFAANQTILWEVDGQLVSASATAATPLAHVPVGPPGSGGFTVQVPGSSEPILIRPPSVTTPGEPTPTSPQPGPAFNGMIAGALSATPSGAAVYTVSISTPPGVGGMAPDIKLVYNSQAGDGIAGQGWSMTGLSAIHRCPKTLQRDGLPRPVTTSSLENASDPEDVDGICLDGQRLWEDPLGSGKYKPEHKDFSLIRRQTDGSFVIQTKTGEIRHYGSRPDARVERPAITLPIPFGSPLTFPAETVVWLLDRVVDAWGNFYDLHYNGDNRDFRTNGINVSAINYTGHLGAGVPLFAEVRFEYESRPDVRTTRFGAFTVPRSQRLKGITTPVGTYTLTYDADKPTLPSRLAQIDYCAPAGTTASCTQPMRFAWTWGDLGWQSADQFKLPDSINPDPLLGDTPELGRVASSGTQLIDLDADGRPDFVSYRANKTPGAWYNDGTKFVPKSEWNLPKPLSTPSGKPGAAFGDIDGDGFLDLVVASDSYYQDCSISNWFYDDQYCKSTPTGASPVVYFNRLKAGQGWVRSDIYSRPNGWATIDFAGGDSLADVDGDGRADLVRLRGSKLEILSGSDGSHWIQMPQNLHSTIINWPGVPDFSWWTSLQNASDYHLEDINRDGLMDIVSGKTRSVDGGLVYDVLLNKTLGKGDAYETLYNPGNPDNTQPTTVFSMWKTTTFPSLTGHEHDVLSNPHHAGDIDGDGLIDIFRDDPITASGTPDGQILFSTGLSYALVNGANGYLDAIRPLPTRGNGWGIGGALVDLNSDGLADWVETADTRAEGWPYGGRPFINTGSSWQDVSGPPNDSSLTGGNNPVPVVPINDRRYGLAYVDLNGDGVTDAVQAWHSPNDEHFYHAWLNTFRPPVITGFPDGLAPPTSVGYEVITTPAAKSNGIYSDSNTFAPGTKQLTLPMRVVASVTRDGGAGGLLTTFYAYSDLRDSVDGHGPQGFATVKVTDPLQISTLTTYAQARPYTGLPLTVTTDNHGPMSVTENTYCHDTWAAGTVSAIATCRPIGPGFSGREATFVHPTTTKTKTYLRTAAVPEPTEPASITVTTTFETDELGNPTRTVVTTDGLGESRRTTTVSHYGDPQSATRRLGLAIDTTKTAEILLPANQASSVSHTTAQEYEEIPNHDGDILSGALNGLALVKTKTEPGAGDGLELHLAFKYDEYGNVTKTTSCATHFDECQVGAAGPASLPFRTTETSYDPADFNPSPAGVTGSVSALTYWRGRFPVKGKNAEGHVHYLAFDPKSGLLTQQTGPNGVHTCYAYDLLGRRFGEVARCGSDRPLGSIVLYNFIGPGDVASRSERAALVTTTIRPDAAPTWEYTDARGRPVTSVTNGFDGGLVQADTHYDPFGRVDRVTKPHRPADPAYATATEYDTLGRPWRVTTDLGPLVAGGPNQQSVATVEYAGATTRTTTTSAAGARTRSETKNVLGKMAKVVDAAGKAMTYGYDADGNLELTTDPVGNVLYGHFDRRGRRDRVNDPDLGVWSYQYNGYGDFTGQVDAVGRGTTMTYDRLGRMIARNDGSGSSQWIYDRAPGAGVGKLAAMVGPADDRLAGRCSTIPFVTPTEDKRAGKWIEYNALGELKDVFQCSDGDVFQTTYAYDTVGRQSVVRYPAVAGERFGVRYHYTSLGYLQYVADDANGELYWTAAAMNALGQVTDEHTRNGVETVNDRSPATGWMLGTSSIAHADGENLIQRWAHGFDKAGNLMTRERIATSDVAGFVESFNYDPLDRLTGTTITGAGSGSSVYKYDALGNITEKGGATYSYTGCGGRPHAVCQVGSGGPFTYDGLGNLTDNDQRHVTYDAANKVVTIISHASPSSGDDNGTVDIAYGAERERVVQAVSRGAGTTAERTVYVGMNPTGAALYERTSRGSEVEHVQYIYAGAAHGGGAFAVRVLTESSAAAPSLATRYHHFDHLGSITATSDEVGHVVGTTLGGSGATVMGYDAWGSRRNPDGSAAPAGSFDVPLGRRGFTGQETIPTAGLVNMNGRVYDPALGRFLSPDPDLQSAADLQDYNRYSYVLNNPLRYTDPTGYRYFNATPYQITMLGIGFAAAVGCPFTGGATCGLAASALSTALAAGAVHHAGGDFGAVFGTVIFGIETAGFGTWLGVASGGGGSIGSSMLTGVVGSLVSTAFSAAQGNKVTVMDVLLSVTEAAMFSGISAGMRDPNPVTDVAASRAQGLAVGEAYQDASHDIIPSQSLAELDAQVNDVLCDAGACTSAQAAGKNRLAFQFGAQWDPLAGPALGTAAVRAALYGAARGALALTIGAVNTASARALGILSLLSFKSDEGPQREFVIHYTNEAGRKGIRQLGFLIPSKKDGMTYVTARIYESGAEVRAELALTYTPTGFYIIPVENIAPRPIFYTPVAPLSPTEYGGPQPGGGMEARIPGMVPIKGAIWVPIGK